MKSLTIPTATLFLLFAAVLPSAAADKPGGDEHQTQSIEGWTVKVSGQLLDGE